MKQKVITILIIFSIFLCGCNSESAQTKLSENITSKTANDTIVYITKTGECYHLSDCSCLGKSKIPKTLYDASQNYRPCQLCFPPIID